jgi:hypothetical protein
MKNQLNTNYFEKKPTKIVDYFYSENDYYAHP